MKVNKLTIQINVPAKKVFGLTTSPKNTQKWIDFISYEETNEWPPKLGTVYKNLDKSGVWRDLVITKFEQDKMFIMTNHTTGYNVRYTLNPIGNNTTELEYYEWMDDGERGRNLSQIRSS